MCVSLRVCVELIGGVGCVCLLVPLRIEKDLRLAGGGEIFYFVVFVCFWVVFFPEGFVVFLVVVTVHRDVLIRAVGVGPLGIDARGIHCARVRS